MVFKVKGEKREANPEAAKTQDYEQYDLNQDMGDGDTWTGQPFLTGVYENDYGYSANLYISNHENEERLRCRVKVKNLEDNVSFWEGSLGFDLVKSIQEQNKEDLGDSNVVTLSFKELQEYINDLEEITIKVVNHNAIIKGEPINWNTIVINSIGG